MLAAMFCPGWSANFSPRPSKETTNSPQSVDDYLSKSTTVKYDVLVRGNTRDDTGRAITCLILVLKYSVVIFRPYTARTNMAR